MGDILVKATSEDEFDEFVKKLWPIVNHTGGWVGCFDDNDQLGEFEVRLISYRASDEELKEIWERVRAGEDARSAWEAVQGPSYQHRKEQEELRRRVRMETNLEGSDLRGAGLNALKLQGKNLRDTNLQRAGLRHSDLSGADLTGADLAGAQLNGANLTGADLTGASLTGATYDSLTRWPSGFDPRKHGAEEERREGLSDAE